MMVAPTAAGATNIREQIASQRRKREAHRIAGIVRASRTAVTGASRCYHSVTCEEMPMTTTLKLPPELKTRTARVARGAGLTPHAFMIEALAQQTEHAERRRRMTADALAARAEFERTGLGYAVGA